MVTRWPDRRLVDLIGCEHPIIHAPMANAGGVELAVAASEGGALASLPCGMLTEEQIREQVLQFRQRSTRPINLNFLCHRMPEAADDSAWRELLQPYYDEFGIGGAPTGPMRLPFDESRCAVVEELKPEVVSFHYGLPPASLLERVKATGAVILSTATTVAEARWLEQHGADAVIAQGFEAGGHSGRFLDSDPAEALGLLALLPQVVDAASVPVIAAGGIADGRGIAAAMALGASAVQIGTAFMMTGESLIPAQFKPILASRPTVMTNVYSGGLARAPRGRLIEELGPLRDEAPPFPLATAALMPLWRAAQERGDWEFLLPLAGQSAGLAKSLPATELVRHLATDAMALIGSKADA